MKHTLGNIIFYLVVSIPAYFLIYFGLVGTGIIQPYSSYYTPFLNYVPSQQFALYYILIGSGIIFGIILRLIKKSSPDSYQGIKDFLKLKSGLHTHHCEISSLGTYLGIGAFLGVIVMYFVLQISILNNLIILFGISLVSGISAVIFYRAENRKWPF